MSNTRTSDGLTAQLRKVSPSPARETDAGLRAISHYERRLPKWRHRLRQRLIPIVRWETPLLARLQTTCRSQFLDSYFAFTANLGTHTFYLLFLPICFWFGFPDSGIALVHMLALGVYLTGVLKDLLCLPRPLSPPLQRITMSGSAALEYGFPSTHTTNAVSVALFFLIHLQATQDSWSPISYRLLSGSCYFYAASITLGRMYCGMHGIFDIVVGAILGAFITWVRVTFGPSYDMWLLANSWSRPALAVLALALSVRFHPEPADNCPCFDDSVAFIGVVMGTSIAVWHYGYYQAVDPTSITNLSNLYALTNEHVLISIARLLGGIAVIFVWRALMKPFLLRSLPPTFRFVDHWGLMIPRRYFLQARYAHSSAHIEHLHLHIAGTTLMFHHLARTTMFFHLPQISLPCSQRSAILASAEYLLARSLKQTHVSTLPIESNGGEIGQLAARSEGHHGLPQLHNPMSRAMSLRHFQTILLEPSPTHQIFYKQGLADGIYSHHR